MDESTLLLIMLSGALFVPLLLVLAAAVWMVWRHW